MRELAIVFFALAVVAEVGGLLMWRLAVSKSRKGVTASATVVERIMLGNGERDTVLIVTYIHGDRTIQAKVNAAHAPFQVAPGDTLEIGYDPDVPGRIVLRNVKVPVSVFALGGISLLLGLLMRFAG